MCDTLGRLVPGAPALFAKNSDRGANEPQPSEWFPPRKPGGKTQRTTYIEIEAAPESYGFVLSRPVWLWGGEMGVNEHGVCIGNEAVFTKGKYGENGLIGMDLLRLALERASTAAEAVEVIQTLLENYGQGGDCGYDHAFHYDNAFLIMDRNSLFTLETAGKAWALKQHSEGASISNRLSLRADADCYSGGVAYDFTKRHADRLYTHFSGSKHRLAQTAACLAGGPDTAGMMRGLQTHREGVTNPLCEASVGSACMHAGAKIGDHTTASWVVELRETPLLWVTGCSTPCISLFKPYLMGTKPAGPVYPAGDARGEAYWREREAFHRAAIGSTLPADFYAERQAIQTRWLETARELADADFAAFTAGTLQEEATFYAKWLAALPATTGGKASFQKYWQAKNGALEAPAKTPVAPL